MAVERTLEDAIPTEPHLERLRTKHTEKIPSFLGGGTSATQRFSNLGGKNACQIEGKHKLFGFPDVFHDRNEILEMEYVSVIAFEEVSSEYTYKREISLKFVLRRLGVFNSPPRQI